MPTRHFAPRLATGVLTQQQKVGVKSEGLFPESWNDGPTWQQHTLMTAEMLHLDRDFVTTAMGTSVFQVHSRRDPTPSRVCGSSGHSLRS